MLSVFLNSVKSGKVNFCYNDGEISVLDMQVDELYGVGASNTRLYVNVDGESGYIIDLFRSGDGELRINCRETDGELRAEKETKNAGFIAKCMLVSDDETGVALSVKHTCGRVDSIIVNRNFEKMLMGSSALVGLANIMCVGADGRKLYRKTCGNKLLYGKFISFTEVLSASAAIVAELDENIDVARLSGRFVYLCKEDKMNVLYKIRSAECISCGVYNLDVTECTFFDCGELRKTDTDSIKRGAEFKIIL